MTNALIILLDPSAPQYLTVNVTSSRSLLASWLKPEMPNGPIDSFRVYVHTVKSNKSSLCQHHMLLHMVQQPVLM